MLFNSLDFLIFLPVVFAGYWLLGRHLRLQNLLVVVASYVFYGWWDARFLVLIAFTSLWSYLFGLLELGAPERSRGSKLRLALSCVVNLGILGYFKYAGFFVHEAAELLNALGFHASVETLKIVLPVGISFYTFQALSYTIDVYRRVLVPTRDPIAFFAFISFFPQLVAGPIERATNLLPQFLRPRTFSYPLAVEGCRQMLWGFFKKILVADSCAQAANVLLGGDSPSGVALWLGMVAFAFQIYGDFSGYSDIAIGCGKLFGIRLMRNFACPYFSRDIAEFWRRWHISLTTWFRDYLYIPLGGSRCGTAKKIRNTFAIFLVSGLWHGANWTFLAWGAFHALCFVPLLVAGRNRAHVADVVASDRAAPSGRELRGMLLTFLLAVVGWTFFRAPDIATACAWLGRMFSVVDLATNHHVVFGRADHAVLPILVLLAVEWTSRRRELPVLPRRRWLRWLVYYLAVYAIFYYRPPPETFVYFQF